MEIVTSWMEKGLQQGKQEGLQQGKQEGLQQGKQEGLQEGTLAVVLRQLRKRCGPLDPETESRLARLPVGQLEDLGEALLDFTTPADLSTWLQARART